MGRSITVLIALGAVALAFLAWWPKRLVVIDTHKVCQLTGTFDRERLQFFQGRVGFGITGSDLGYPVEHRGQLHFLFGDTRDIDEDLVEPNAQGGDAIATAPVNDDPDRCPQLSFAMEDTSARIFRRIKLGEVGRPPRSLGRFETPISGFSHAGFLWAFFTVRDGTTRCSAGSDKWRDGCALGDATPGGETFLAKSSDGSNFEIVTSVSTSKFQWVVPAIADASEIPGLPPDVFSSTDQLLLMWASGREEPDRPFRHSYVYLAVAKITNLGSRAGWVYYCAPPGRRPLRWCEEEDEAQPLVSADSDAYGGEHYHRCLGEFSVARVTWGDRGEKWLMMYACGATNRLEYVSEPMHYNPNNIRGVHIRTADHPWGPWSHPHLVFEPRVHNAYCHYMHAQGETCTPNAFDEGQRDRNDSSKRSWGGEYAPFLIPSYTKADHDVLTLYFTMSTWNPYQVVLMTTQLREPRWYEIDRADLRGLPALADR